MDDIIEITVTINSHSFPLVWEFLNGIPVGRRRAAALKRAAESFLLLQTQSAQFSSKREDQVGRSGANHAISQSDRGDASDQTIDPLDIRRNLSQFSIGE
jgi:hypothetical protein